MERLSQQKIFEDSILDPVIEGYSKKSQALCGFMALKGHEYKNKLMVVGRAVNSWGEGKSTAALQDLAARQKFIDGFFYPDGKCQMAWVWETAGKTDGYNTNKSAFWRVIRRVSRRLGVWHDGQEESWSSRIVWSNLYKISPHAGGNPSDKLCALQEPGCIELLRKEIEDYKPQRILFLTGMNWAKPFLASLGCQQPTSDRLVEASGTLIMPGGDAAIPFVVASHPQGKPESEWVEEVISRFEPAGA
mgnify:FL=1